VLGPPAQGGTLVPGLTPDYRFGSRLLPVSTALRGSLGGPVECGAERDGNAIYSPDLATDLTVNR